MGTVPVADAPASSGPDVASRRGRDRWVFLATAALVVILDQVTKAIVIAQLPVGGRWPGPESPVSRFFTFTHVGNTGVAFGMFQGQSDILLVVSLVVIAALLWYRRRAPAGATWLNVALGLQVGGAIGNLVDRVRIGHVTDFLDFQVWPVFNVADSAIFLGVVVLGWHMWQDEREASRRAAAEAEPHLPLSPAVEEPRD